MMILLALSPPSVFVLDVQVTTLTLSKNTTSNLFAGLQVAQKKRPHFCGLSHELFTSYCSYFFLAPVAFFAGAFLAAAFGAAFLAAAFGAAFLADAFGAAFLAAAFGAAFFAAAFGAAFFAAGFAAAFLAAGRAAGLAAAFFAAGLAADLDAVFAAGFLAAVLALAFEDAALDPPFLAATFFRVEVLVGIKVLPQSFMVMSNRGHCITKRARRVRICRARYKLFFSRVFSFRHKEDN
jgi:hypothetical protein